MRGGEYKAFRASLLRQYVISFSCSDTVKEHSVEQQRGTNVINNYPGTYFQAILNLYEALIATLR